MKKCTKPRNPIKKHYGGEANKEKQIAVVFLSIEKKKSEEKKKKIRATIFFNSFDAPFCVNP